MLQGIKESIKLGRIALGIEKPAPRPCNCGEPEPPAVHPDQMEIEPEPVEADSTPLDEVQADSILP